MCEKVKMKGEKVKRCCGLCELCEEQPVTLLCAKCCGCCRCGKFDKDVHSLKKVAKQKLLSKT